MNTRCERSKRGKHLRHARASTIVERDSTNAIPENCTANGYTPPLIRAVFFMGRFRRLQELRLYIFGQQ